MRATFVFNHLILNLLDIDWTFVEANIKASPPALRLKYHGKGREMEITQIECRQRCAKKLAETLARHPRLVFPSVIAAEQATSDVLANLHATLADGASTAIDLTAGLGIDASHLAAKCRVTALELDPVKADALRQNFGHIIQARQADCRDYIDACHGELFDVAFIDPSRRAVDGSRAFALADCQPDVTSMLPALRRVARRLIVKVSPMLDVSALADALAGTCRIIAFGTPTECKELVAVVDLKGAERELAIDAVTVGRETVSFTPNEEREAKATIADNIECGMRLYEPYPAVMKAAPFNILSQRWSVRKLHPNTHLYVSRAPSESFPGEEYTIEKVVPYESKHIKRLRREYPEMEVTCRNFDMGAEALRRQLGVKDSGPWRLFAAGTQAAGRLMLICRHS